MKPSTRPALLPRFQCPTLLLLAKYRIAPALVESVNEVLRRHARRRIIGAEDRNHVLILSRRVARRGHLG